MNNATLPIWHCAAGYGLVDLARAQERGIRVVNVSKYTPSTFAEHTVLFMLVLGRNIVFARERISHQNFSLEGLVGAELHGRT